jgi:hypothetical protein
MVAASARRVTAAVMAEAEEEEEAAAVCVCVCVYVREKWWRERGRTRSTRRVH